MATPIKFIAVSIYLFLSIFINFYKLLFFIPKVVYLCGASE